MPNSFYQYIKNSSILDGLEHLGFKSMTPIQELTIPKILNKIDVLAQASTGSGKTLAFGIPLLTNLPSNSTRKATKLILAPTRELAIQTSTQLRQIASFMDNIKILTLCGGTPLRPQAKSIEHGADILVGTPGRILDHLEKNTLVLDEIDTVVLDEADKMLDMGFLDDVKRILHFTPAKKQTLFFSATFSEEILQLSKEFQNTPETLKEESFEIDIKEYFFKFSQDALEQLLYTFAPKTAIIFCNTKLTCNDVAMHLQNIGFDALVLHSDLDQYQREETLTCFLQKSCSFLVATDLASRGLDIKDVSAVINYELPHDVETYIHRIGRTGRMGKEGLALSLYKELLPEYVSKDPSYLKDFEIVSKKPYQAEYSSIYLDAGKKQKLRKGDILGAFLQNTSLKSEDIGDITLNSENAYIAIKKNKVENAHDIMKNQKIKNKKIRLWLL